MTDPNSKMNHFQKPIGLKDLKNDRMFKFYFKTHKQYLIQFLNTFLPLEQGQQIKKIHFLEEKLPNSSGDKKESFLDIRVDLNNRGIANKDLKIAIIQLDRFHKGIGELV